MASLSKGKEISTEPVWRDMDQKALDDAYDQSVYATNRDQIRERTDFVGERVRARLGNPRRLAYGRTPIERLDLYPTDRPNAPVSIFVHGGAWLQRWAKDYAFLAEMFVRAGAHFVALDFVGVDETDGNLLPVVEQVRRGVAWVYRNAESFGGDPERLFVFGHSSGAHLAGNVVTTDWSSLGLPEDIVKGALLCSGMYDLEPVRLSKRSEYVSFTDEIEESLSPQRRIEWINCPIIVSYGTYETPEFQRQSRDFAFAVEAAGKSATLLVCPGFNHFEMCEMIGNPIGPVGSAILEQMDLE